MDLQAWGALALRLEDDLVQDIQSRGSPHCTYSGARPSRLCIASRSVSAVPPPHSRVDRRGAPSTMALPGSRPPRRVRTESGALLYPFTAFRRLAEGNDSVDHLMAAEAHGYVVNFEGQAVLLNGHRVSAEVTALLGLHERLRPAVGRTFLPSEFAADTEPVIAISHRLWTTASARQTTSSVRSIIADGKPLRIVGVLSREFDFFPDSDILAPLTFSGPSALR